MNTEKILCAVWQVEQSYILFQQDSAAGFNVDDSLTTWGTMFHDTVKSWQPICINFYLWGNIKNKLYKMCSCMVESSSRTTVSQFQSSWTVKKSVCVFRQHFSTSYNTGALTLILWCRMTHIEKILYCLVVSSCWQPRIDNCPQFYQWIRYTLST